MSFCICDLAAWIRIRKVDPLKSRQHWPLRFSNRRQNRSERFVVYPDIRLDGDMQKRTVTPNLREAEPPR